MSDPYIGLLFGPQMALRVHGDLESKTRYAFKILNCETTTWDSVGAPINNSGR